jgi:hypothetical protein
MVIRIGLLDGHVVSELTSALGRRG